MLKRCCGILCKRVLPVLLLAISSFIFFLSLHDIPEGVLFATIFPVYALKLPPPIFGHGLMSGTPPVPKDKKIEPKSANVVYATLPGGALMPKVGLGMCCRPSAYDDILAERSVLWFLLSGGRHIDTAHLYLNHRAIGKAIKEAIRRGIPREEIFVTTKVFPRSFGEVSAFESVSTALEELQLEYVDLILLHMPSTFPHMRTECTSNEFSHAECRAATWRGLSKARKQGLVLNLGVSNFNQKQIMELQDLNLAPVANHQMQYNPWAPDYAEEAFQFCVKNKVSVTAYASLGGLFQYAKATTVRALENISTAHPGRSISQVLLRWAVQKGAAVIPGSGNPDHIVENLNVYDFELSDEEMQGIDELKHDKLAKEFFYMPPNDT